MAASLELAITAIRAGRKEEGRQLLNLLIQQNPNDELAWLWMSSVVNTDEQRARCLYHVLAINPTNELARRGLKILGIVVTDSRPVKIPRDSQPIPIPKPTPASQPTFPSVAQVEQAAPVEERRPFRIDPQAIVAELPFTPVRQLFADGSEPAPQPANDSQPVAPVQPLTAATPLDTKPLPDGPQIEAVRPPSQPVPVGQPELIAPNGSNLQLTPLPGPVQPAAAPVMTQPLAGSETAILQAQPLPEPAPPANPILPPVDQNQAPQYQAGQFQPPSEPAPAAQPYYPQYPPGGLISRQETRPTQPLPAPYASITQGLPQQGYLAAGHTNASMGMPPHYSPTYPAVHSNPTLGLPPGQYSGPLQPQSQPLPAIHSSSTMAMPLYPQPQFQPALAYNPAVHSNATMAMPLYDPLAILSAPLNRDYRTANPPRNGTKRRKQQPEPEEDEGDEVNILAVIIFGSLSVTALGGLGMLILLMFTAT